MEIIMTIIMVEYINIYISNKIISSEHDVGLYQHNDFSFASHV